MCLELQPSLDRWQLATASGGGQDNADRQVLADRLADHARRLGTGQPAARGPIIASGHQAWLWHPGILAKDLAMFAGADRLGAGTFHVVVDQDVNEALSLELPVVQGKRLTAERIQLGPWIRDVPTGCQPAVGFEQVQQNLHQVRRRWGAALAVDVGPILDAFADPPDCRTLAEQLAVVVGRLRRVVIGSPMPVFFASSLAALPSFQGVLERMLHDAPACVSCYNQAAGAHRASGVGPLRVEPDRVELPLWALAWCRQRQRVFADLAGDRPLLTTENGQPIDRVDRVVDATDDDNNRYVLAPRALLMTAALRRWCCDLFVHGKGGALYDTVTDDWWRRWLGQDLAPTVRVSADLTMDFQVPIAGLPQLDHAVWWTHHVRHNADRVLPAGVSDGQAVAAKRHLLDHMNDDRDPVRRAEAFRRIHEINRRLIGGAPQLLSEARDRLDRARAGVANHRVAAKRDWCFGLYKPDQLRALAAGFGANKSGAGHARKM